MRHDDGFTLVEMLVVLAIIAVAAGAIAVGVGSVTRAPSVETEARRLATRLQAAADDAMLGDRVLAFTVSKNEYGFATVHRDGSMTPLTSDAMAPHAVPAGMEIALSATPPIVLGVNGESLPLSATVKSGENSWIVTFNGLTARAFPAGPQ